MKVQVALEWSLLNGIMKANFNKKYDNNNEPGVEQE
jgi:hypothetical protein